MCRAGYDGQAYLSYNYYWGGGHTSCSCANKAACDKTTLIFSTESTKKLILALAIVTIGAVQLPLAFAAAAAKHNVVVA